MAGMEGVRGMVRGWDLGNLQELYQALWDVMRGKVHFSQVLWEATEPFTQG